jgi:hypothetical protein
VCCAFKSPLSTPLKSATLRQVSSLNGTSADWSDTDHVTVELKHPSGRFVQRELCKLIFFFSCRPFPAGTERGEWSRVGHLSGDYVPNWSAWPIINGKCSCQRLCYLNVPKIELVCIICISTVCFQFF